MRWLLMILVVLNLVVFLLAIFSGSQQIEIQNKTQVPIQADEITLLPVVQNVPADCVNVGPILNKKNLGYFQGELDKALIGFSVITEDRRLIQVYRVLIGPLNESEKGAMRQRLEQVGVKDFHEKSLDSGGLMFSLGVFTYQKTAQQFKQGLVSNNFPASIELEELSFEPRYWLNLTKPLSTELLTTFKAYAGSQLLSQQPYLCR